MTVFRRRRQHPYGIGRAFADAAYYNDDALTEAYYVDDALQNKYISADII